MNELVICLFCFVFRFCITLIQGTNDILFASFCLSVFNAKIFFFLRFGMSTRGSWYLKWIGYRKKCKIIIIIIIIIMAIEKSKFCHKQS